MGRILAIDYGTRNIGLAITDEDQITVQKLPVLHQNKPDTWQKFLDLLDQYQPEKIIIGYPSTDNETLTTVQKQILEFKNRLIKLGKNQVELVDESFTSQKAEEHYRLISPAKKKKSSKIKQKKEEVNSIAAGFILFSYLKRD